MKKLLGAAVAAVAIALVAAPTASADDAAYFNELENNYVVVWDYPEMLRTGYDVCDLLWQNINPDLWLRNTIGYDSNTASAIITSARVGLCPGNAVTSHPPQLKYAA